jgi:hypothetical protein
VASLIGKLKMIFAGFLCYLRQRLLDLRDNQDQDELSKLFTTLLFVGEAAEKANDSQVVIILDHLVDATRDSLQGVEWKSYIPSVEEIEAACELILPC